MLIDDLFPHNGLATRADLLTAMDRKTLARKVRSGAIVRVWRGVYAPAEPDLVGRLAALDLLSGVRIVACMHTAATLHGFGTESPTPVHILDPGVRMRSVDGLIVHQRVGAPLQRVGDRLVTALAWTAVEVARTQHRPRCLATLDAALRGGSCDRAQLVAAIEEQKGRRGIVRVRELLELADGRAESVMESEARMVMFDGGLPTPELQYEIVDRYGQRWRVDFAWPDHRVVAEYESIAWHSGPEEMLRDRKRTARIQESGWTVVPIVATDLYRHRAQFLDRLRFHLGQASLAS